MRYFLEVGYNGLAFHGSQIQGEQPTVQLALNQGLSTLLRQPISTFGASRTDSGVHALCNFYHFDTEEILTSNFLYRLNAVLPFDIVVKNGFIPIDLVGSNARFDATSRQYTYRLYTQKDPFLYQRAYYYPYKINQNVLLQTSAVLHGRKDFTSFSKRNTQSKTALCTIEEARWVFEKNTFRFTVRANRFLRGMVRALVGTQLQVARGRMTIAQFKSVIEAKDCTQADFSVPGFGLYLEKISYPDHYFQTKI